MPAYRDLEGEPRMDRTVLILGGGLAFRVGDRLHFDLSARDHVFSDQDLQEVNSTDQLMSNWMLGASVGFNLAGDDPTRRRRPTTDAERRPASQADRRSRLFLSGLR